MKRPDELIGGLGSSDAGHPHQRRLREREPLRPILSQKCLQPRLLLLWRYVTPVEKLWH